MAAAPPATDLTEDGARALDAVDPLASYRARFLLPPAADGRPKVYLAGQSLGAQPVTTRAAVEAQLDAWARLGVDGHFDRIGWYELDHDHDGKAPAVDPRPALACPCIHYDVLCIQESPRTAAF